MFQNVEFHEIHYNIKQFSNFPTQRKKKKLLLGVSGVFRSGQLSAILGPSGAGKSSLLNAVSGFRKVGVNGTIHIDRKESCYITQEDFHQPMLTVEELMNISFDLKMKNSLGKQEVIDDILTGLHLNHQRGCTSKQLSGGERKRLSIALELITNPLVFFLDEPTSGLDEVTAAQCLRMLKNLAMQGKTVVCTIHQPSAAIFALFDQIFVLAKGQCVYQGSPQALVPYLTQLNLECPTHYNPSDFLIEICDSDNDLIPKLSDVIQNGKLTVSSYSNNNILNTTISSSAAAEAAPVPDTCQLNVMISPIVTSMILDKTKTKESPLLQKIKAIQRFMKSDYTTSGFKQFLILFRMMLLKIFRNRSVILIQICHHIVCGITMGCIFYGVGNDGERMFDHLKYAIGIVFFFSYTQIMVPILNYPLEVKLVKKECFNRWYGLTPYYMALTFSRIPLQLALNMLFIALTYWLPGLPMQWWRFCLFAIVGNVISLVAEGLGLAIGATFSITNGCAMGPMIMAPMLGLAIYGFDFAPDIPFFMNILMKFSFLRGGIVSLVLVIFGFDRPKLSCHDLYCHFDDPKVLLRYVRIEEFSLITEVGILVGLMLFFRVILYISLKAKLK